MKMLKNRKVFSLLLLGIAVIYAARAEAFAASSDEEEVRATIQRVFDQLKSGEYDTLYNGLPTSFRARIKKDRFVNGLQRMRNVYRLDRIEIGAIRVSGNMAVADTTVYAHVNQPFEADVKLEVQQYLVREVYPRWSVATGDNTTINRFLRTNPSFARKFPIRKPRTFIKQNGAWVEVPVPKR